ncbi:MAG TPA: protein kinase [Bryobacteraceae bacterium]|nr:protein kinase [Bryobacteraceae bacterium]
MPEQGSNRRERVEEIVLDSLALAGARRADYLDSACGNDKELRGEVDSLLAQEIQAKTFLEKPALEVAAKALASEAASMLLGRTVGPYRVDALLGAGGMGEVYRGWDPRLRRVVALKFMASEFLSDAAAVEQFQREARAASALSHPGICTVYDVGDIDGRPFIAMEYLEGETLRARLNGGVLSKRTALEYAVQIAHGLEAAHQKGVVHRDLKPENLWVTGEGRMKILDFGLAKVSEQGTDLDLSSAAASTGQDPVMGTVGYMSPEQVRGEPLDHRTDIFSFGTILHEMLAGSRAFHGLSSRAIVASILNSEPQELATPGLNRLVRRCLEKDPARRFQSAADVASHLEAERDRLESAVDRRLPRRRILQTAASAAALAAVPVIWTLSPARWRNGLFHAAAPRLTRLAVLPLANLSGDAQQEYFADGMTDLLITNLGQIAALHVISRPSVMQFKGTKRPLAEIAKQLGVEALVVGSVQSSGARVRITAELIDPVTGQQMWTRAYERELTDVLTLQSGVARAIADEVQARVTTDEAGRLARNRKVVPAALDAYLLGSFYWDQFKDETIEKAIDYYNQAIRIDPTYAAAYGGLATCWSSLLFSDSRPWEETIAKARAAAEKALTLDDSLAESHHAVAMVRYQEWDWKGVESELKKAIALNPGNSISHMLYCNMLRHVGRFDEAIAEGKLGLEADPLSMLSNQMLGDAYVSARRYDLAIGQFQRGLELHPGDSTLQYQLGWAYVFSGAYDKGIQSLSSSQAADGVPPSLSPDLAYVDALTGKRGQTRQVLNRLLALAKDNPVSPGMIALVYTALDERPQILEWLEKAYQQHSSIMTWLKIDPRFDRIRPENGFQDLMRRVGLI